MPTIGQLRKSAKEMGIAPSDIRGATSAEELQALIMEHLNGGSSTKAPARSRPKSKPTTVKRGRPAKTVPVKSKPAAKSTTTGKAKRSTSATTDGAGRRMLTGIDYSVTDGWHPREGSPPDQIVKALRRFKGNRTKVYDFLLPKVWDFVGRKMADGSKRSKESAESMLAYRISRTAWDFAMRTGQHEKSEHRAEYGTGTRGTSTRKPQKAAGRARTARKPAAKAGATRRPVKAQTAAQTPKRRGRPPGSKNRPKVAATRTPVKKKNSRR